MICGKCEYYIDGTCRRIGSKYYTHKRLYNSACDWKQSSVQSVDYKDMYHVESNPDVSRIRNGKCCNTCAWFNKTQEVCYRSLKTTRANGLCVYWVHKTEQVRTKSKQKPKSTSRIVESPTAGSIRCNRCKHYDINRRICILKKSNVHPLDRCEKYDKI